MKKGRSGGKISGQTRALGRTCRASRIAGRKSRALEADHRQLRPPDAQMPPVPIVLLSQLAALIRGLPSHSLPPCPSRALSPTALPVFALTTCDPLPLTPPRLPSWLRSRTARGRSRAHEGTAQPAILTIRRHRNTRQTPRRPWLAGKGLHSPKRASYVPKRDQRRLTHLAIAPIRVWL